MAAAGYGYSTPKFGAGRSGVNLSGTAGSAYYRLAQQLAKRAQQDPFGLDPRPDDRAGPFGATPIGSPANYSPTYRPPPEGAQGTIAKPGDIPAGSTESVPGTQGGGNQTATAPASLYDLNTDPILQQIKALSTQTRENAETGALSLKKQLAIAYGDTSLADQLGDTATRDAAAKNPYSVTALLGKTRDTGAHDLDEQLNQGNLFYSGERIKQQGNLTDQYQQALAQALAQEQGSLGDIENNRLAAVLGANADDVRALTEAEKRQIDIALQNGWTFGGWGADGKPILIPPDNGGTGGDGAGTGASGTGSTGAETTPPPPPDGGSKYGARSLAEVLGGAATDNAASGRGPLATPDQANPRASLVAILSGASGMPGFSNAPASTPAFHEPGQQNVVPDGINVNAAAEARRRKLLGLG